eukprot:SAG11_NODE_18311_length_494_cov_2.303797_1_plen_99_part_00
MVKLEHRTNGASYVLDLAWCRNQAFVASERVVSCMRLHGTCVQTVLHVKPVERTYITNRARSTIFEAVLPCAGTRPARAETACNAMHDGGTSALSIKI